MIRRAFKIDEVVELMNQVAPTHADTRLSSQHVSEHTRGEADIDKEFIARENNKFVVHDSSGFESGDTNGVSIVKDFIARRSQMSDLKDKVHAIWYVLVVAPRLSR